MNVATDEAAIERTPSGYLLRLEEISVVIEARQVRWEHGALYAVVSVRARLAGVRTIVGDVVTEQRVNLSSDRGRKDVAAAWINKADYEPAIRLLEPLWDGLADLSVRDLFVVAYCDRGSIRVIQGRDTKDPQILLDGLRDIETSVEYDRNYKKGWE